MPSFGQEVMLTPNARIRVKPLTPPTKRVTGSLIAISDDSLSLQVRGQIRRLALTDVSTLQLSAGRKPTVAGTVVGGLTGALAGLWIGASIENATTEGCTEYCGLGGGLIGFAVGGIGGLFAGYFLLTRERWTDVPVESLRVGIGPAWLRFEVAL